MKNISIELKRKLTLAVQKNRCQGLLFSGGLDTSILAALDPGTEAISVSLESFGEDIRYAKSVVGNLKLKHFHRTVSMDEAIDSIPEVIRILKTFDPAIPNDIVVYFGLKQAKEIGVRTMMTGDGSDELFAGYNFMRDINDLEGYIKKISSSLCFSSNDIGKFFGIEVKQPYLDEDVVELALSISSGLKIKEEDGTLQGKWILRKAFEDILPQEVIWQDKRPLEYGSGMTRLREVISSRVSDDEYRRKAGQYRIKFINKEHLYYYEIYRSIFGEVHGPRDNQRACPACGAGIRREAFHCQVCGWAEPAR